MVPKRCLVYCIEGGILELFTLLSINSFRKFGGSAKDSYEILCFQPRKEFRISQQTRIALHNLNVQFIDSPLNSKYKYYSLANKPIVCSFIEEHLNYDHIVFIDSDTLFLDDPIELNIPKNSVAVCHNYFKGIGAENHRDLSYDYWEKLYQLKNKSINKIKRKETFLDRRQIVPYWNTAVISVNQCDGLFQSWKELLIYSLEKKLFPSKSIYFTEESTFSVNLATLTHIVKDLPIEYNFPILPNYNRYEILNKNLFNANNLVIIHHLSNISVLYDIIKKGEHKVIEKFIKLDYLLDDFDLSPISREQLLSIKIRKILKGIQERAYYFKQKWTL